MSVIKIENLKKHFGGVKAVDGVTATFLPGQITGLIGPNGSGKSTLINLLTGMMAFDSGVIYIGEHTALKHLRPAELLDFGITRTFQDIRLFEQMPVLDNILIVTTSRSVLGSLFEKHKKYHLDIAEKVLRQVGLWDKRASLAHDLSYGQRKLLEIARVLALDQDGEETLHTVLFDEPFAGLFPEMIKTVSEVLNLLRAQGKTVVLVEHNMDIIRELSDQVIVLDSGKVIAEGAPSVVLSQPNVVEAYLGK
jgi:ABC-type branched-subunit amino acid transport system ATPase component